MKTRSWEAVRPVLHRVCECEYVLCKSSWPCPRKCGRSSCVWLEDEGGACLGTVQGVRKKAKRFNWDRTFFSLNVMSPPAPCTRRLSINQTFWARNTDVIPMNGRNAFVFVNRLCRGSRWRIWLRHFATSRMVASSIPDGVIGIFHWHYPSGRTMALGLTQPLTEMSTRNISWG